MYKEIAHRLFQHKVISLINVGNNRAVVANGSKIFAFELHLTNRHNPADVTLANVENALQGILTQFEGYSEIQIKVS